MKPIRILSVVAVLTSLWAVSPVARAWDREHANIFAVLPKDSGGPEGLEVDPEGNVYVSSYGFTSQGPLSGQGKIFVYDHAGRLVRELAIPSTVEGASSHLLGLRWHASNGTLLVADFGGHEVLEVNPLTGDASVFMKLPTGFQEGSSLNDITFDKSGNVYVSDSFQGIIWMTTSKGGTAQMWAQDDLLTTTGVPPFGANGLRFNNEETALFVANTGNDTIVKIPVQHGPGGSPTPGKAEVFVNSINGADGLIVDDDDNLWVAANQADEIVVVDPDGQAVAKLGDFGGVDGGVPRQLLFPASLRFSGDRLLVTNLALDLRLFNPEYVAVDSAWCALVTRYTVVSLPARIPPHANRRAGDGQGRRR